jgi:valyl-tRNA synthetase
MMYDVCQSSCCLLQHIISTGFASTSTFVFSLFIASIFTNYFFCEQTANMLSSLHVARNRHMRVFQASKKMLKKVSLCQHDSANIAVAGAVSTSSSGPHYARFAVHRHQDSFKAYSSQLPSILQHFKSNVAHNRMFGTSASAVSASTVSASTVSASTVSASTVSASATATGQCQLPKSIPRATDMASAYNPDIVEAEWYKWWNDEGLFAARPATAKIVKAENKDKTLDHQPVLSMVLPPPNVTGVLHIGHALTASIQDVLARFHRMHGASVSWVPGLDHAGIATQVVVERQLHMRDGVSRHDIGREKFIEAVWEWKEQYGGQIQDQHRSLGASVDWAKEYFTLDEERSKAVTEAFVRMHDDGLIYRSTRMINWCAYLKTAVSDIEVDVLELQGPTKVKLPGRAAEDTVTVGEIHRFAYAVEGADSDPSLPSEVVVATTRIETMFGDTAVAVHPDDERYQNLSGKCLIQPITGRRVPIIFDANLVDPELGTGAVKVTPAHDHNDNECGQRHFADIANFSGHHNVDSREAHDAVFVTIMNDDGTLNDKAGPFCGMDRLSARPSIIAALKDEAVDAYRGCDDHPMKLAICSRSGDILEPVVKPQWFVKSGKLAADAIDSVEQQLIRIFPQQQMTTWRRWLENPHEWCISRQLWWGHRVPAYRIADTDLWIAARSETEAKERALQQYRYVLAELQGVPADSAELKVELVQDEDVLDTWFSSALLPLSAHGWPNTDPSVGHGSLPPMYPLTVMETGTDILFFWVARMAMLCTHLSRGNGVPFKDVLLHPLIRDAQGRKMSKSSGNVIDPLDFIHGRTQSTMEERIKAANLAAGEKKAALKSMRRQYPKGIPQCGSDALRFALCSYLRQGDMINLESNRIVSYRHFCNKLWQAARFVLNSMQSGMFLNTQRTFTGAYPWMPLIANREDSLLLPHRWVLHNLGMTIRAVNSSISRYDFGHAVHVLTDFFVSVFCSGFIEFSKPFLKDGAPVVLKHATSQVLVTVLEKSLRLLHPFMPFVTEELWQHLVSEHTARAAASATESKESASNTLRAIRGEAQWKRESISVTASSLSDTDTEATSIMVQAYPHDSHATMLLDIEAAYQMQWLLDIIHVFRSMTQMYGQFIAKHDGYAVVHLCCDDGETARMLHTHHNHLEYHLQTPQIFISNNLDPTPGCIIQDAKFTPIQGVHDPLKPDEAPAMITSPAQLKVAIELQHSPALEQEVVKLRKKMDKLRKQIDKVVARMSHPDFTAKTPEFAQQKTAEGLELLREQYASHQHTVGNFLSVVKDSE